MPNLLHWLLRACAENNHSLVSESAKKITLTDQWRLSWYARENMRSVPPRLWPWMKWRNRWIKAEWYLRGHGCAVGILRVCDLPSRRFCGHRHIHTEAVPGEWGHGGNTRSRCLLCDTLVYPKFFSMDQSRPSQNYTATWKFVYPAFLSIHKCHTSRSLQDSSCLLWCSLPLPYPETLAGLPSVCCTCSSVLNLNAWCQNYPHT